jgi:hypothetical protein
MKDLEKLAEDLAKNPPVVVQFSAEADPAKYQEFVEHKCKYAKNDPG